MPELSFQIEQIETLIIVMVGSYLLGSIAFGIVVSRLMGLGNLRNTGSGNVGASNVLRTGNKLGAFLTLALDMAKGFIPVMITSYYIGTADAVQIAGFSALIGSILPIWHGFRGGKGVAVYFGIVTAISIPVAMAVSLTWLASALISRKSSVSSLVAALAAPILALYFNTEYIVFAVALTILIWLRHHENIQRLFNGTEPNIKLRPR